MKKRNKMLAMSLVVSGMLLVGCGTVQESKLEKIGLDAAKEVALKEAGIVDERIVFTSSQLDSKNDKEYYDIDFIADGHKYEYDIDALTGIVIESKKPAVKEEKYAQEEMEQLADDMWKEYEEAQKDIETIEKKKEEYKEAAEEIVKTQQQEAAVDQLMDEATAKEIALNHAGVSSTDITFVKSGLEWDDGRQIYDVEFYGNDYTEYDYEIDAVSGQILDFDYDAEYYEVMIQNEESSVKVEIQESAPSSITEQDAKELALSQVPGATLNDIYEFEVDYDDGRIAYEGTIIYGEMEYDFEIDGYSGAIREWDAESIYD